MGVVSKWALAALLAVAGAQAGQAADSTPSGPVPPPPGALPPPPTAGAPAAPSAPAGAGVPEVIKEQAVGDWTLRLYKLPGPDARLCVVTRNYPSGETLGLIIAAQGNGFIYGNDKLSVKDGEQPDISFSVDRRPVIDLPAAAFDQRSITSLPLPRPDGDKLIDIFARGKVAALGSDKLGVRSGELPLTGGTEAVNALRGCARDQGVQTYAVGAGPLPTPPGAPTPAAAPPAPPAGTTPPAPGAPPPAAADQSTIVQPDIAPEAEQAIKEAVLAEAKKHKAGVGVAVTMPKDVTGDNIADAVIIFTLLEGDKRQGYAMVLKTIGQNKFKPYAAVPLGGVPADDPPIFADTSFSLMVTPTGKTTPVQVTVTVGPDKLSVK